MALRCLDLFSGIGGFSHALRSVAKTVAYCDVDPKCRAVLQNLIVGGLLHRGPVFEDVTQLKPADLAALRPNMIAAGFPCTDISAANPRGKGLDGLRSGLFREILRIIDELGTINVVFLENSPLIVKKGFHVVQRALQRRGFTVRHCVAEAKNVGAPHKRARWYCLCVRPGTEGSLLPVPASDIDKSPWRRGFSEPKVKAIISQSERKADVARCQMLGNSIVPQCAMHAWNALLAAQPSGSCFKVPPHRLCAPMSIVLADGLTTVRRQYWATPTYSVWYQYRSITRRGIAILSNQLYYSICNTHVATAQKRASSHLYCANPRFIEFMMGYPKDWTRARQS